MAIGDTKICTHCKIEKEISDFYRKKSSSDGFDYICKDCYRIWNSDWYISNRERALNQIRKYRQSNHEYCLALTRKWFKKNPDKCKERHLKYKAKRRNMKCIKLFNNPFSEDIEVDYHHINDLLVVPLPRKIHNKNSHNNQNTHRNKCNVWLYKLYGINIAKLLNK